MEDGAFAKSQTNDWPVSFRQTLSSSPHLHSCIRHQACKLDLEDARYLRRLILTMLDPWLGEELRRPVSFIWPEGPEKEEAKLE